MLRISDGLALNQDFVTKTCAILAQRRKGKTYTASVLAEEFVAAQIPFVVLDPTGAWWGLRAAADGKREGLPVVILGGQHGDIPLNRSAGKFVADLVVDEPGFYVIDFSLFESGQAEKEFATDFAQRLYRRKGQPNSDFALHLIVDEADRFVPQRIRDKKEGDEAMLGAFEAIVRRGGLRGLGTTLISQRAAVINKNVLEQIDVLIVLRVVGPNDRKAIMEYATAEGTPEQIAELRTSMASLNIGEAWVWEPGEGLFARVHIRERRTFNSSATPKAGEKRVEPRRLAAVDLDRINEQMAESIEKVKATDPKFLHARIQELERTIRAYEKELKNRPTEKEVVEVQVIPTDVINRLVTLEGNLSDMIASVDAVKSTVHHSVDNARAALISAQKQNKSRPTPATPRRETPKPATARQPWAEDFKIGKGENKVLAVLRQWPEGRSQKDLHYLTGYSKSSSTLGVYLSKLRQQGLVEPGHPIRLTEAGMDVAGGAEELPMGDELLEFWRNHKKVGEGERKVLDILVATYPQDLSHDELCDLTGYSPTASTVGVYLSHLRKLGLVEKGERRLADQFAQAIA